MYSLREATVEDAAQISALVQRTFAEFVAPDWEQSANEFFLSASTPERFGQVLRNATYAAVATANGETVGFILLSTPSLLSFLFVSGAMHRQGIASALWESARNHLEANHPATTTVELNSSPHAVPAYRALGFYPISEPFRRGGCLATRMACWLPGRALLASKSAASQETPSK